MKLKVSILSLLLTAAPAFAETVQESVVRQLQEQGFNRIEIERTFLGRVRIQAFSDDLERELVFNPNTGEILRDFWEPLEDDDDDDDEGIRLQDPYFDADEEDEEDDEDEDDEEDDDEDDDDEEDEDEDEDDDDDDDDEDDDDD